MRKWQKLAPNVSMPLIAADTEHRTLLDFQNDLARQFVADEEEQTARTAYAAAGREHVALMGVQRFGSFGELQFVKLLQNAGIAHETPVVNRRGVESVTTDYDVWADVFNRVEIKSARLKGNGDLQWSGMRMGRADTYALQAFLPDAYRLWDIPITEMEKLRSIQTCSSSSLGLSVSPNERLSLTVKADDIPDWMAMYEVKDFETLMSPWRRTATR